MPLFLTFSPARSFVLSTLSSHWLLGILTSYLVGLTITFSFDLHRKNRTSEKNNTYSGGFYFNIRFSVISLLRLLLFLVSEGSRKELVHKHKLVASGSQFYPQNLKTYVLDCLLMRHFSFLYRDVYKDVINHIKRYESESGDLGRVHEVKVPLANFVTRKA